ncbi:helix-turn-helix domain-containing protein [Streptomyces sp. MUSC 14]|uniref:helix-turn-helix domain-containing protein n=1 Tax=Streptomyces sp. MUSC 14 TaxID=1354889 RepID=UPI0015A63108|nr:helix-turn-helix transcriptional regulator [Streptomyces sp. MUSC 14]
MGRRPKPLDPNQPLHAFAIQLRLLRDRAGAASSEKETCERAEIGRSTYYSYLNGENLPSRENLERVIKAWGGDVAAWLELRRQAEEAMVHPPAREDAVLPHVDWSGSEPLFTPLNENELLAAEEKYASAVGSFYGFLGALRERVGSPAFEAISATANGVSVAAVRLVFDGADFLPARVTLKVVDAIKACAINPD